GGGKAGGGGHGPRPAEGAPAPGPGFDARRLRAVRPVGDPDEAEGVALLGTPGGGVDGGRDAVLPAEGAHPQRGAHGAADPGAAARLPDGARGGQRPGDGPVAGAAAVRGGGAGAGGPRRGAGDVRAADAGALPQPVPGAPAVRQRKATRGEGGGAPRADEGRVGGEVRKVAAALDGSAGDGTAGLTIALPVHQQPKPREQGRSLSTGRPEPGGE